MIVDSMRLGQIEVPEDKLITMRRPVLGFERLTKFCLVESDETRPLLWLQSAEDPDVAFLVVNPVLFWPDYKIEIDSREIAELKVQSVENVETYVVVSFTENPNETSANLQGPILINTENNCAKQLVLVNSEYHVQHSILDAVESLRVAKVVEEELVGV